MNYLKSVLAGIAAAIITIVIFGAALLGVANWRIEPPEGGIVAVIVTPDQVFLAAVIGFALGFWRSVRKQRLRIRASAQSTPLR